MTKAKGKSKALLARERKEAAFTATASQTTIERLLAITNDPWVKKMMKAQKDKSKAVRATMKNKARRAK